MVPLQLGPVTHHHPGQAVRGLRELRLQLILRDERDKEAKKHAVDVDAADEPAAKRVKSEP